MEKVSVVVTILNEEQTLPSLFQSLENQTCRPDEVVITDGGSTDNSTALLKNWHPDFPFRFKVKKGNRSVGRNEGIILARHNLIAITDAGCIPHTNWLKYLLESHSKNKSDVVAGYYKAKATTPYEQAASAYMLVMPEKVDPDHFLPATRSMALTKSIWKKAGGFDPALSHNEDYAFAHRLKAVDANISFSRQAIVTWMPPHSWKAFLIQVGRFAYGDAAAGIWRPKVISIYIRWLFLLGLLSLTPSLFVVFLAAYCFWAYWKNHRHVKGVGAIHILPLMQVSTDWVVMAASLLALITPHEK